MVDTQDLKSCDCCGRAGSSPARGTFKEHPVSEHPATDIGVRSPLHVRKEQPSNKGYLHPFFFLVYFLFFYSFPCFLPVYL